jgi:DNA polymerase V
MTTIPFITHSTAVCLLSLRQTAADPEICPLPLLQHLISAPFPSPADKYIENSLDVNTYLVRNKAATFFFRVIGDSMIGANIHDGDILVVDRSIEPKHRHIVLVVINNEYTVKRLYHHNGVIELHAENPAYPPIGLRLRSCAS